MHTIHSLDPLAFPLHGSHLIEASAGTGKTFTIAMLYVRLVLGHGNDHSFSGGRSLTPPEILVVTFTEAATKELRDRIRARLAEAASYFRAAPDDGELNADPLLRALRADYPEQEWPLCARKLELAAEWMDEAAVSTIHGWCNRMLREHAFDSQSLFTQNLETDQTDLRAEVVRDYWRIFFYPLALKELACVASYWKSPDDLGKALKSLLGHAGRLPVVDDPAPLLRTSLAEKEAILESLKAPWRTWADELQAIFDDEKKNGNINGKVLKQNYYTGWFNKLRNWANSDDETVDIGTGWERLTAEGLAAAWKTTPPTHPAFDALPEIKAALANLPNPQADLLAHAACWVAQEFAAAQKRRAQIGFNDLLTELEAALNGPYGDRLAEIIRAQFPVALIDEFQDTDPVQYRIFERVYEISANRDDSGLILIGDPKQAIYAFRGADIYTYLKARTAVDGRLYTLDTNYRSTQAMVEAANHCFIRIETEESSAGAFLFRRGEENPVPFQAVNANGRKDDFLLGGQTLPAMSLTVAPTDKALSKERYIDRMSEICATQMVDWLNDPSAGFAGRESDFLAIKPGDMAVLVNNGNEAKAIRQALARRGVRSVYLSDKDTVYATPQADEVYRWLAACAEPDNDRLLRAALSTASLGLSFAALDELNVDEEAWEARVVQFKGYREMWQKQGVLPVIRRILRDFGGNDRLLSMDNLEPDASGQSGERILTDLLHLAELLQQASFTLEGEHALIRFLAEQIAEPGNEGAGDGKKLRLESDADLVKVVTIHKSKGLEYPLVFLPFICATRLTKDSDVPLKWHDEAGKLQISLKATPDILASAERDRLGEDLRKLYVALTRARYLTWLGLAPVNGCEPGAIGHLFGLDGVGADQYLTAIQSFAEGQPSLSVTEVADEMPVHLTKYVAATATTEPGTARRPNRAARENWWISSYSALPVEGHAIPEAAALDDTPEAQNLLEEQRSVPVPVPVPLPLAAPSADQKTSAPMHRFPKGAEAGTFLHDLMEWAANKGFPTVLDDAVEVRDMVARRCKVRRWEAWVDPLVDWMGQMLSTPLPIGGESICLNSLHVTKAEMEFWFEAKQVDLGELDAAIIEHTLDRRPRPRLTPEQLNGMLKGFMDLVFLHEGRYFVADYKSNWLGTTDADYTPSAMDEAIRAHRYDLQYAIYLLALHRLLKSRLPDYDYDRHVGGAAYLFVRGLGAPSAGVHYERPPKALIESLDALFAGETA
ncbi:exodeoxyribonuclease V subunit beta [Propionivibrio limicola]|uniref:exodeoxyribonuclease V subunit beta n=1 Tax=Propionivibrio limicola TaxID=167645 RepID=UPI0012913279|nr:exodeoxyribonuclease V subunit beta [Propionivibrio limicola]